MVIVVELISSVHVSSAVVVAVWAAMQLVEVASHTASRTSYLSSRLKVSAVVNDDCTFISVWSYPPRQKTQKISLLISRTVSE